MEIKSTTATLFLLILLLSYAPFHSTGESEAVVGNEIYEIDYRGPETHSSVPPPHAHSLGKPLILHRSENSASVLQNHPKSKGSRKVNNMGRKAKKVHG
ncbi:hypothetical protein FNV43_RR16788 [Rhamnella rubrinervis]|uniref:Uncharacterized protein n=1 Tax=Rhamnella rubrinervis TaxID=2594499 RepID=A0A8K0GZ47_9ROSA|nr:hypothetical protein FNV43_RR16629 [Rhamnella rubrinervis]KAF3442870.1 hypothetical protein FNV43_RR16788 [Rhamnella rubrinervis]